MRFVYCRVGRGAPAPPSTDADGLDTRWDTYRRAAQVAGLQVGGYWRMFPSVDLAVQVQRFTDRLGGIDLPPMVDVEDTQPGWSPTQLTDWAVAALEQVQQRTGVPPIFYTYPWFLGNALDADRLLARWRMALAAYTGTDTWPDDRAVMWQYAGNVSRWGGNVDLDYWLGNLP